MSDTTSITGRYHLRSGRRSVLRFFLLGLDGYYSALVSAQYGRQWSVAAFQYHRMDAGVFSDDSCFTVAI